jgi:hypothetical protein
LLAQHEGDHIGRKSIVELWMAVIGGILCPHPGQGHQSAKGGKDRSEQVLACGRSFPDGPRIGVRLDRLVSARRTGIGDRKQYLDNLPGTVRANSR